MGRARPSRLAALQAITAALVAVRTPMDATRVVLSTGLEALGAAAGGIAILSDDGTGLLRLAVEGYRAGLVPSTERLSLGSPAPVCFAVRAREAVFLADQEAYELRFPEFACAHAAEGYHAAAALPLVVHGRVLGCLALSYGAPQPFGRAQRAYAATLAELVALALDRTRLYEAEWGRARVSEDLAQVGALLSATLEPGTLYARLLDHFSRILPFDHASVLLHEEGWAVVAGSRGQLTVPVGLRAFPVTEMAAPLASGDGGRPALVRDTAALGWIPVAPFVGAHSIRSVLVVPLLVDGNVVGTFNVDSFTPDFYTERHLALAVTLGDHLTMALRNARLYTAERERARAAEELARVRQEQAEEEAILGGVGTALYGALDPEDLYGRILEQAARVLPCDFAAVMTYVDGWATVVASRGEPSAPAGTRLFALDGGEPAWHPGSGASSNYLQDTAAEPSWRDIPPWVGEHRRRSVIAFPLDGEGEQLGYFTVSSRAPHAYTERHLRLVGLLAERTLQALRNARLYAAERERASAAENLAQLRSDFVAAVSHELRTPLTAVLGYAELLQARWPHLSDAQRLDHIARIVVSANRQHRLVADLLLIAQIEDGVLAVRAGSGSLAGPIHGAAQEVRAMYRDQLIHVEGSAALAARIDPNRLQQIVANLLDNAAKYSPEGAPIAVGWRAEGDWAAIRVRDHGPGIPDAHRGVLFTRFGRVPGSRIRSGHVGTGLGLYLSRQLAGAMEGELDLESTGPGGSTFVLRLPLAAGASVE